MKNLIINKFLEVIFMKLMFASDIHGSLFYLKELMKRYEAEKPEKLTFMQKIKAKLAKKESV